MTENDEDREDADFKKLKPSNSNERHFEQSELSKYLQKRKTAATPGDDAERDKS